MKFSKPIYKRRHVIFAHDGSVHTCLLSYIAEKYAEHCMAKFDGDEQKAIDWVDVVVITNPSELVAFGPQLYVWQREDFEQNTQQLIPPYADTEKVYDPSLNHTFTVEWYDHTQDGQFLEASKQSFEVDRFEVACAVWECLINSEMEHQIHKVVESHNGVVLNTWKARSPETFDYELTIVQETKLNE